MEQGIVADILPDAIWALGGRELFWVLPGPMGSREATLERNVFRGNEGKL